MNVVVANDSVGEAYKTTDPAGTESRQEFDDLGRVTKTVQNDVASPSDPDEDVTVERTYNADGALLTLTAKNSTTDDQITRYVYGTATGGITPLVYRNDLLRAEIYPDSDDPTTLTADGGDGVYDRIEFKYNRQSQRIELKDQIQTVRQFVYDAIGRQTDDKVTTLGSGVDGSVRRIARAYEVRGMVETITSYDAATAGNVVNDVELEYNDFAQVSKDYQQHNAVVNVNTSPKVQYAYTNGSSNHTRLTGVTYPNARVLHYDYSLGHDGYLSRVSYLSDTSAGGTRLAEYTYLGRDRVLKVDYSQPDLRLDMTHRDGNGLYDYIDRFGRVVDHLWYDYDTPGDAVRIKHGYDRAGNRLYREDSVAATNNVDIDELYDYDGVYQLTDLDRGDLNANKNGLVAQTKNFAEEWLLDPTGNWDEFKQDTDGDDDWDLDQDRDHTKSNEIDEIDSSSTHVAHDKAGNMTKTPKPSSWAAHYDLTYDAWNRLVEVEDGENTVAKYEYDGRNYRTVKKTYVAGQLDETRYFYYTNRWQCIEERVGASSNADRQFVWGTRYVDDLILRDRDTSDPQNGTLNERLYSLHDPNWNLVAIAEPDGDVIERYTYNAYGKSTVHTPTFGSRASTSYDCEYRYTTRRLDLETGMMYYRNRYYHAEMGRFINRDPLGFDSGDENLYRYVDNRPLLLTDPLGLDSGVTGPCEINIWAGDTLWSKGSLARFLDENQDPGNHPLCPSKYPGVVGCGDFIPGKISDDQQIPEFPGMEGGMSGAEIFEALEKALEKAKALAKQLCENRKKFCDDGTPQRYECGASNQRCDSVSISVDYDKYISKFLHDGIAPGGIPVPGFPNKESKDLLKKLNGLNRRPETTNCLKEE